MERDKGINPWDIEQYGKEAMQHRLNGVHRPFWRDWPLANPCDFLTLEPLHHWHKQFWDHDIKWCINAVGEAELDFRFSVLQPQTGYRHFKEGISSLKQVTGKEHRNIQRYIIGVIADAVPSQFLIAVRSLMDFHYLAQSKVISEKTCSEIEGALLRFHSYKDIIIKEGAQCGKKGKPIENWHIPKLEFLQSVTRSIHLNGIPIQFSADTTEHAHIEVIKEPSNSSNNHNYESQICRHLDRIDKVRFFDLATEICSNKILFANHPHSKHINEDEEDEEESFDNNLQVMSTSDLLSLLPSLHKSSPGCINYFYRADYITKLSSSPMPYRTQIISPNTAFHLSRDPTFKKMSIQEAAELYNIADLYPALFDYIDACVTSQTTRILNIGGRRRTFPTSPVTLYLQIWKKVRLQNKEYHFPHDPLPPVSINAHPPSISWPQGYSNAVIANIDPSFTWPESGIKGQYKQSYSMNSL